MEFNTGRQDRFEEEERDGKSLKWIESYRWRLVGQEAHVDVELKSRGRGKSGHHASPAVESCQTFLSKKNHIKQIDMLPITPLRDRMIHFDPLRRPDILIFDLFRDLVLLHPFLDALHQTLQRLVVLVQLRFRDRKSVV